MFYIDHKLLGTSPSVGSLNKLSKLFVNYNKQLSLLEISAGEVAEVFVDDWAIRRRKTKMEEATIM